MSNERNMLAVSIVSMIAVFLSGSKTFVKGYPMMLEVEPDEERCLRVNIPEDDDAHMVFLVIPSAEVDEDEGTPKWVENYKALESHFMGQMQELTKRRTKNESLLRRFPAKPPPDVQASVDEFLASFEDGSLKTDVQVTLTNPKSTNARSMDTYWFTPLVVNHVRRAVRTQKNERESSPLEGYEACFENDYVDPVHVIVDSVMVSEGPDYDDDETASEDATFQGHHLEPLAQQLENSIRSAKSVINEMRYMERREARMRHTADSINKRVQNFSYISIAILLVVTYLQVTYLKRYFRKKKLL